MIAHLEPCPTCRRHIRADESRCPFCDVIVPSSIANAPRPATVSAAMGSSQKFAYRALAAGAIVTACGGEVRTETDQTQSPPAHTVSAPVPTVGTGGAKDDTPVQPRGTGGGGPIIIDPVVPPAVSDAGAPASIYRASPAR
jgi:hypothetical protein